MSESFPETSMDYTSWVEPPFTMHKYTGSQRNHYFGGRIESILLFIYYYFNFIYIDLPIKHKYKTDDKRFDSGHNKDEGANSINFLPF